MSLVTTPFGPKSTTDEVLDGVDLSGRRVVVTGAASGIGAETARALAAAGAQVTLAVRNLEAGREVAARITAATGRADVTVAPLELTDPSSVDAFTRAWEGPLHVLVNNAGIMALPDLRRTGEGWELQFATNHMGHFRLALGLHGALAAAGGARVVAVSSNAHRRAPVVFDDLHFERRPYEAWAAYAQSKSANALFAVEAAVRWADDGITANSLNPGGIRTGLQRHAHLTPEMQQIFDTYDWRTPEQGAATSVLLAASPLVEGVSGRYFEDCAEAAVAAGPEVPTGVQPHAVDPDAAARLWKVSSELMGL
ncbi:SDR family NAD(P)-dependent oxidoreductase [Nonomuraea aridisoli]|uniref:Probable oxidoreductase n=1 Tax=Nonomuraea aridisoli TaxID=2070368 RepID=A0A2W2DQ71_9ACTN|nr:SDR family NAD(P)-dependent oxidoreductase [Nonomuraea aridisoli]PZG14096.1 oxidoreductase [Nonomuraea aridisoli]